MKFQTLFFKKTEKRCAMSGTPNGGANAYRYPIQNQYQSGILAQADAAAIAISRIQQKLENRNQKLTTENQQTLDRLRHLFQDPVFRQLLRVQVSISQLKEHNSTVQQLRPRDFDIVPENGALEINGQTVPDEIDEEPPQFDLNDFVKNTAQGRQVETIDLFKPDNSGLGFSVVGLMSEYRGELGIFVQDIQPGSIAGRDGRLVDQDQILAINGTPLESHISHQEAINILQSVRGPVQLIIARGNIPAQVYKGGDSRSKEDLEGEQVDTGGQTFKLNLSQNTVLTKFNLL